MWLHSQIREKGTKGAILVAAGGKTGLRTICLNVLMVPINQLVFLGTHANMSVVIVNMTFIRDQP